MSHVIAPHHKAAAGEANQPQKQSDRRCPRCCDGGSNDRGVIGMVRRAAIPLFVVCGSTLLRSRNQARRQKLKLLNSHAQT